MKAVATLADAPAEHSARPWARVVTEVLAPANLVIGLLVLVAWHSATTTAGRIGWGVGSALFAGVLPLAYLIRGARRGNWEDHHVGEREKRPAVIIAILASVLVGIALAIIGGAPRQILALMGAMAISLVVTLAVTVVWKVSVHAAVAGGTVVVLALVFGSALNVLWPIAALVGWSRVELRDHTIAQVTVGLVLGASVGGLCFATLR